MNIFTRITAERIDRFTQTPEYRKSRFEITVDIINDRLEQCGKSDRQKCDAIDLFARLIKDDMITDMKAYLVYFGGTKCRTLNYLLPPELCRGNIIGNSTFNLAKADVLVKPHNLSRLENAVRHIGKADFQQDDNHSGQSYKHMNLSIIHSGNHSITAAVYHQKGSLSLETIDESGIFPILTTNGADWIYTYNSKATAAPVLDYRMALIYHLAKEKYRLCGLPLGD
jgi:hypothetical protein